MADSSRKSTHSKSVEIVWWYKREEDQPFSSLVVISRRIIIVDFPGNCLHHSTMPSIRSYGFMLFSPLWKIHLHGVQSRSRPPNLHLICINVDACMSYNSADWYDHTLVFFLAGCISTQVMNLNHCFWSVSRRDVYGDAIIVVGGIALKRPSWVTTQVLDSFQCDDICCASWIASCSVDVPLLSQMPCWWGCDGIRGIHAIIFSEV